MLQSRILSSACTVAALAFPLAAQSTIRLTTGLGGAEPDGDSSLPAISGDGRFVVFESGAGNLVSNDTSPAADVFLYDAATNAVELISVRSTVGPNSFAAMRASASDDGNLVVFESNALDLVPGDVAGFDVFLRDRAAGTTTRVTAGWDGDSRAAVISPDGRYIAFTSFAANPVPSGPFPDVFRLDRQTGQFVVISRDSAQLFGNGASGNARISADGTLVAFSSVATNFDPTDVNVVSDVFVRDVLAGTTQRVSASWNGIPVHDPCELDSLSNDGRRVCFESSSGLLTSGDQDGLPDVFVRDRLTGELLRASTPASWQGGGGGSQRGRISGDGRYVAFVANGNDLVPVDPTPFGSDVYLKDLETGAIEIVSLRTDGTAGTPNDSCDVSDDGRFVVFASRASLVPGDVAGNLELYRRDRGAIVYTTPCAGDNSGTPCPCGNPGYPGNGCENYAISGGVRLSASGTPSLANDTLRLELSGFLATFDTPIAFAQGDALLNGGLGAPFGDGIQCVGGSTVRFGRRIASGGTSAYGAGVPGDAPLSVAGHVVAPGSTRYYQCVYFNFGSFCGQLRRNWSNSIAITWGP